MTPPPTPPPTLGGPKSPRIRGFKVGFSKLSGGGPPHPPSYKIVTFMHVALLALFFGSRDYSTCFSGFLVLGQADPCITMGIILGTISVQSLFLILIQCPVQAEKHRLTRYHNLVTWFCYNPVIFPFSAHALISAHP